MKDTFHKFIIGVAGPTIGIAGSKVTASEWMQLLSLTIGIAVGIASFISICFSIRRKYNNWRNEVGWKKSPPKTPKYEEDEATTTI